MKILFFSRLFYPHIGGVEKHVKEISKILIEKGHDVTILTEKFDKSLQDSEIINSIKIIRIDNGKDDWFKKFRVWINVWNNRKLIIDADIIHAHDVFFWFLPFRLLFLTKKIFVTFHGYEGNNIPNLKSKLMHKMAEKLSNGNICVGDFLKKWYGTKPDYVTYGGVDTIQNSLLRQGFGGQAKYKVLFIGRLEEETGIMEYLKALKELQKKKYKFEIVILGDGSLRKNAEKFVLENKIKAVFKGFVKEVNNYISNCDFVFASRYLGILESLAFKKFVFAHYNNSIKKDYLEMAPFANFISIAADYKQLSLSIEHFFKNERERKNMIDNGYRWVKDKTWENLVNIYMNLWGKS